MTSPVSTPARSARNSKPSSGSSCSAVRTWVDVARTDAHLGLVVALGDRAEQAVTEAGLQSDPEGAVHA